MAPHLLPHQSTTLAPEVSNVSAATPPVMIAQNEDDPSAHVENSLLFYYHLKRAHGSTPPPLHASHAC